MRILQPNRTNTFIISDTLIKDDTLTKRCFVKTGVYSDGNCFTHCILRAIDSNYRKQNNYTEHIKIVENFKKKLLEWLTFEKYKNLGNSEVFKLNFIEHLTKLLSNENKNLVLQILTSDLLINDILSNLLSIEIGKEFYTKFCKLAEKKLEEKLQNQVDSSKIILLKKQIWEYFVPLFKEAHDNAYNSFKEQLGTMNVFSESSHMECISDFIGYNLLFITQDKNGEPVVYKGNEHMSNFDENRKTLIFLWISENHFEIIGELDSHQYINRIFDSDDNFVIKLRFV
jgi:hypothetical protein